MSKRLLFLFLVGVAVFFSLPSRAGAFYYGFCSEPSEPSCLMFGIDSKSEFDYCKMDVESYISDVESFLECLNSEAEDKLSEIEDLKSKINDLVEEIHSIRSAQDEARDEANRVIERFNCYARGDSFCP